MKQIENETILTFENVLSITDGVMEEWEKKIYDCIKCRSDHDTMVALALIAEQLLSLFKASYQTYSICEEDLGLENTAIDTLSPPSSQAKPDMEKLDHMSETGTTSSLQSFICIQSHMTLGQLTLDTTESRLLAAQLIVEGLSRINGLLEGLRDLVVDQWSGSGWNQLSKGLLATDALINLTIERSVILVGQVKSPRWSSTAADSAPVRTYR